MFKPGWKDIFRMNQNELESEIRKVYRDSTLDPRRKAYLVQNLLTSHWIAAQQKFPQAASTGAFNGEDVLGCSPSFHDPEKQIFGCEHYNRNCKLRAACCRKFLLADFAMTTKSLGDMTVYFGMPDALLAAEELPEEYRDRYQDILCDQKGTSRFHWWYPKCGSYNTRVIKTQTPTSNCSSAQQ
ncbi:hypothetical protein V6N12_019125 [Hibiscus sabdariffa]|uniref:CHY-type domain-containing protein n=1 Tax=Hibiscus sabdariffa TaxID=183260 RepID=A0ABR2BA14_9ROSI